MGNKKQIEDQKRSRHLHLVRLTQAPSDRNPARHATVKVPLQSEASLKCHLHCLGPHAASLVTQASGRPPRHSCWAPAGGFELGLDQSGRELRELSPLGHYSRQKGQMGWFIDPEVMAGKMLSQHQQESGSSSNSGACSKPRVQYLVIQDYDDWRLGNCPNTRLRFLS